jgi:hypothetical protein
MTEIEGIKEEIKDLAAESFALQVLVVQLANRMGVTSPELAKAVFESFDEAANFVEQFSITHGRDAGHITRALKVIEEMRSMVGGKSQPKHGV